MGLRETINKNQPLAIGLCSVFIILGSVLVIRSTSSGIPARLKQAYYSDDDGKTFFADDVNKIYPFDHNGKTAYKAYVYEGGDGQPFVGYLERLTDSARQRIAELQQNPDGTTEGQVLTIYATGTQIKLPGDTRWISPNTTEAERILQVKSPSGDTNVHGVYP